MSASHLRFYYFDPHHKKSLGNYPVTTPPNSDFIFSNDGKELKIQGIIVDEISRLGSIHSTLGNDEVVQIEDENPSYFE